MVKASRLSSMALCSNSASLLVNRLRELLCATATRAGRKQDINLSLSFWPADYVTLACYFYICMRSSFISNRNISTWFEQDMLQVCKYQTNNRYFKQLAPMQWQYTQLLINNNTYSWGLWMWSCHESSSGQWWLSSWKRRTIISRHTAVVRLECTPPPPTWNCPTKFANTYTHQHFMIIHSEHQI